MLRHSPTWQKSDVNSAKILCYTQISSEIELLIKLKPVTIPQSWKYFLDSALTQHQEITMMAYLKTVKKNIVVRINAATTMRHEMKRMWGRHEMGKMERGTWGRRAREYQTSQTYQRQQFCSVTIAIPLLLLRSGVRVSRQLPVPRYQQITLTPFDIFHPCSHNHLGTSHQCFNCHFFPRLPPKMTLTEKIARLAGGVTTRTQSD